MYGGSCEVWFAYLFHFSDGSYTPTEIVKQAKEKNLVVALTDHNTVSGLP